MTLQKKAENRRHATTIVVQVCLEGVQYDVEMVRPLHGRDGVWVRYDADTLSVVVRFMRALGFSEPRVRDTPFDCNGIYKRTDGFVVDCSRTPLGPKYKKVKTLEDAYKVLALSREPLDIREGNHEDVTAEMPSDDQLVLDDHQDGLRESLEVGDPRADCQEGLRGLVLAYIYFSHDVGLWGGGTHLNVYYAVECMRSLRPCGVRTHAKTVEVEIYLHTPVS